MVPFFSFACTGLLLGVMIAFSSDQLSRIVVPLLFAAFGGSVASFSKGMDKDMRYESYLALCSLSVFCLIGIIVGIVAVHNQLLGPADIVERDGLKSKSYLRSGNVSYIKSIQMQVDKKEINKDVGYDKLVEWLNTSGK